ncbi:MAG: Lrp/AsnC family transcriptional regulator [Candidatus Marsarchaeota archaeon]|jgi:Lrp/AsnC family transcriptional regulator for asnA, asnC and gidA|nr:Lrp/AsnC family transcriptional regulator [Candidatus Marsarchaeota archaeon]
MDNSLDFKIISMLMQDGRAPISSMAKRLSVSKGTVRNRLMHLSKAKTIVGYKARVRLGKLGMEEVLIGFDIAPERYLAAIDSLKKKGFIREVYRTTGDHVAIAIAVAESEEIERRLAELSKIEGVRRVYPSFVQETVK